MHAHPRRIHRGGHRRLPEVDATPEKTLPDLVPSLAAISQTSCPLFTIFPAEIRNHIYALSLESEDTSTNEDPNSLYRRNTFYYRPGYKQPKRIQTALLQTCQQIYNEASLLPTAVNEHTFWFYRAPPHVKHASSPVQYFRNMTPKQRAQVHALHFFTQQYFLEDNPWSRVWTGMKIGDEGRHMRGECRIAPRKITFTFRHTDWWFWENNDPLGMDPFRQGRTRAYEMDRPAGSFQDKAWGNQFAFVPSLEEVVIEFETIMRKREQLDGIIQRALNWKFPMQVDNSVYLVADPSSLSTYSWIGAKEVDLKRGAVPAPRIIGQDGPPEPNTIPESEPALAVPTLKPFDPQSALRTGDSTTPRGQLGYDPQTEEEFYVVYLTWRKQRVD